MNALVRQRYILPVLIFSGMNLVLPLPIGAAADELPRESEAAPLSQERIVQSSICCGRRYRLLMSEESSFGADARTKMALAVRPGKYNLAQSIRFDYQADDGAST